MTDRITDAERIDLMGGTCAVARLCEITPGAVSQWRRAGIPRDQARFLRLARPDVWEDHDGNERAD